jgi:hypothetical protein
MRLSSGAMGWVEGLSMVEHGPDYGDAAACESDEGLDVSMSFTSFAIVEGLGERVLRGDGIEGALVENALEGLIASVRAGRASS